MKTAKTNVQWDDKSSTPKSSKQPSFVRNGSLILGLFGCCCMLRSCQALKLLLEKIFVFVENMAKKTNLTPNLLFPEEL